MKFFRELFDIVGKNINPALIDMYERIHSLSSELVKDLESLIEHKKIVFPKYKRYIDDQRRIKHPDERAEATLMDLKQGEFTELKFLDVLKDIENMSERAYIETKPVKEKVIIPAKEKVGLKSVIKFLEIIREKIPNHELVKEMTSQNYSWKKFLEEAGVVYLNVATTSEHYHEIKILRKMLKGVVLKREVGNIIEKVFEDARPPKFFVKLPEKKMTEFFDEAKRVNEVNDRNFHIKWRSRWWSDKPIFESDEAVREKHINIRMIFEGKKKELHLMFAV